MNTITGKIQVGNTLIISGRYKMDIPDAAHYLRTCDILLDQQFATIPTVTASIHHENIAGNAVPFLLDTIEIDLCYGKPPQTRIMIMANEVHAREINDYVYWCEYVVVGQVV
jgi:hypothetical protein